ncbi:transporter substrate-binding domain-containing protein [Oribacterium sp. P6A1]|uniref:transporter substrate-binding domain-containing protein n=1 Tax=Oribacterium sp. P6A1 TaxID=1410612 RepID=UPI00055D1D69|nr:transporter substrate-binding domain-containing protein [Oribacterium sp. P6A1]
MKKRLVLMAAGLMVMSSLAACGSGNSAPAETTKTAETKAETTAAESKEETSAAEQSSTAVDTATGKFTVGFDQEFPPMGFVGDNGEYTGFDLALAEEAAKRLGLEFVPQPINWDAKDMELESGNIDCIWNGFTMQGREDAYTWVGPYMANNQVFVVNGDSDIATKEDLNGKAVEVQKDSSGLNAINDNADLLASFGSLTEVADYNTALMDLESGACDAVCMDSIVAGYQIKSSGKNMKILDDTLAAEEYGIGFKKGDDALASAVKDVLMEMVADGTVEKISNEWFGSNVFTLK